MTNKINKAYESSKNIYDSVLTGANLPARFYVKFFWDVDDRVVARKMFSYIPDEFEGSLLDVPSGTGIFTYRKYSELKKASITCLDYSPDMLEQAKKRFQSAGLTHVNCVHGDVGKLDFEDESFDIVLTMNGFHAFPDKDAAFSETARVLKKGGMFIGCFYIKKERLITDLLINIVMTPKGWFTPPFYEKSELADILNSFYSEVELENYNSMAVFSCLK